MARKNTITKQEIIDVAKQLTKEIGFENFSIRNIAEKCGIATGTIYLYFESKTELLIEIAADFWNNCLSSISNKLSNNFFANLRELYFEILEYLETFKIDWLKEFSNMTSSAKVDGKRAMDEYMQKIKLHVCEMFYHSKNDFAKGFLDNIDENYFLNFLFSNILNMLMRFSHNYDAFENILKRILL